MLIFIDMPISIQDLLIKICREISHFTETPHLDGQVLVAHYLNKPRSWVLAHPEACPDEEQLNRILRGLDRSIQGEPLPYVLGHWEFYGLDFEITPDVLIPRPETELLVERAIKWLRDHPDRRKAIDVGTGSGCVGISLAMIVPDLHIRLTDISPTALNVARINAAKFDLNTRLEFRSTDLLDGIIEHFDLICANLPYISHEVLKDLPVAHHEPHQALDGGQSGIELITRLLDQARNCLAPGGVMLLEIEAFQGTELKNIACSCFPGSMVQIIPDLSGLDRCLEISSSNLIVHICKRKDWQDTLKRGIYISNSLKQSGFIHCSQPQQILKVANNFYFGIPDLILLWMNPGEITSQVVWEASDGALFPHVYGPINLEAVVSVSDLIPDKDGIFRFIEDPDKSIPGR
jgi:release factor glutamine methyltransferase